MCSWLNTGNLQALSAKWPGCCAKLIEDKANGSAVIQMLQNQIQGILPVNPEGGKVARASSAFDYFGRRNTVGSRTPLTWTDCRTVV